MIEIFCKDIKKTMAYHWLSRSHNGRGVELTGRAKIFKETYVSKIEKGEYPLKDIKSACHRQDQVHFLKSYIQHKKDNINFVLKDQHYYNKLRFYGKESGCFATGKPKWEHDFLEKRSHEIAIRRLKSFIKLYNSIEKDGWKGAELPNNKDLRRASVVSILNFATEDVRKIGLGSTLTKKFNEGICPPFRVIDGHHRLACAIVLNMKSIPTIIYTLSKKENEVQS